MWLGRANDEALVIVIDPDDSIDRMGRFFTILRVANYGEDLVAMSFRE